MGAVEEQWWDTVTHNRQQLEHEEQTGIKSTCTIRRLKPLHITECILV